MKKITAILLGMALMCFVAVGVHAGNRTVEKHDFKTEVTAKIVKETVKTVNFDHLVTEVMEQTTINSLAESELNRPPRLILAYATYARTTNYKNIDAATVPDEASCIQYLEEIRWAGSFSMEDKENAGKKILDAYFEKIEGYYEDQILLSPLKDEYLQKQAEESRSRYKRC